MDRFVQKDAVDGESGILHNAHRCYWVETSTNERAERQKIQQAAPALLILIDANWSSRKRVIIM